MLHVKPPPLARPGPELCTLLQTGRAPPERVSHFLPGAHNNLQLDRTRARRPRSTLALGPHD
jgi:hypothetical protein